jgi:LmbE family N-acetylglucosaminyl deacetylase
MYKSLKRHLKWRHVFKLYEQFEPLLNHSIVKESKPHGDRVVILAPHIDDETIGCGGVAIKHAAAGDRVAILTFADCTEQRIAEGRAAGHILGAHRQEFLTFVNRHLLDRPEPAACLAQFLKEESPNIIYAPSLFDRHTDHVAVNILLAQYTRQYGLPAMIYGYEVWSTLTPNVAIDITAEQPVKAKALSCFASQLEANNWHDAALSLNHYRGITTGAGIYAEAFLRMTSERHQKLVKSYWG